MIETAGLVERLREAAELKEMIHGQSWLYLAALFTKAADALAQAQGRVEKGNSSSVAESAVIPREADPANTVPSGKDDL